MPNQRLNEVLNPWGFEDPLPTFGVLDANSNLGDPFVDIYCSDFEKIGSVRFQTGSEGMQAFGVSIRTDAQVSTNSGAGIANGTNANHSEGNIWLDIPPTPGRAVPIPSNSKAAIQAYYGTVIERRGVRPKISLAAFDASWLYLFARGGQQILDLVFTTTWRNTTGEPAGAECYGQISYNIRTRKLLMVYGDNSNNYRAHVWTFTPSQNFNKTALGEAAAPRTGWAYYDLANAYNGSSGASYFYNDFTWSTTGSSSYTESRKHNKFVLGDNDIVGMFRMTPSNQAVVANLTLNPSGTTATVTALTTMTATTSYGIEQGVLFGSRTMHTWDNEWMACYSPYYYYGAGINMVIFNTKDPSKYYTYQLQDSANGVGLAPIGESKFIIRAQQNSDGGNGVTFGIIDPAGPFYYGRGPAGEAIANGAALPVTYGGIGMIDSYYTSTNYPQIIPMQNWVGGTGS